MRSHVFPTCKPGSKTFTSKNKKEGGETESSGTLLEWSETEDQDVTHGEWISGPSAGQFYGNYFIADTQEKSEFLADLTVAPQTDSTVGTNETWAFYTPWEFASVVNSHPNSSDAAIRLWERITKKPWFDSYPPAGSVFCFGVKSTANAAWKTSFAAQRVAYEEKYNEVNPPKTKKPFEDGGYFSDFTGHTHGLGKWATVMWTGTRFVYLGSNNWY
jgi:hypothetical protein